MFPIETYKKDTALILKCIDQLPRNLARVHNLGNSFDTNHKNFNFFILLVLSYSIVLLLFVFYSNFDALSEVQAVDREKISFKTINCMY